ncbi:F-box/kelch-repeat protein At3g06240-like [Henckelia pumila]|uniref:F-box/kelch-repeat protein At3g06240-like n=1 Tax=Henckelia pumila TaxID=405737 RepID=UPI003C6DD803
MAPQKPLPHDLLTDILLRLPAKDLVEFRRVSKAWLSLICSQKFNNAYLKYSSARRLVFRSYNQLYTCPLWLKPGQHEAVPFGFVREHGRIRLVGSCNGLVCLVASSLKESIVLWNPATRKHRVIDVSPKNYEFFTSFGFGYDPSSDYYKVMRVCMEEKPTLATYSLRNKSWTTSDWYHGRVHHHSGVLVNGALHFKVQGRYKRDKCGVVALSLATDQCSRFALPVSFDERDLDWARLGVLGGCLCLYIGRYSTNVWVMKEYGVNESWTEVASFSDDDDAESDHIRFFPAEPMCVWENGDVLIDNDSNMISYSPYDYGKSFGLTEVKDVQAIDYSESFLSPHLDLPQT